MSRLSVGPDPLYRPPEWQPRSDNFPESYCGARELGFTGVIRAAADWIRLFKEAPVINTR